MLGVCWIESKFPGSVNRSVEVLFQGPVIKARALLAKGGCRTPVLEALNFGVSANSRWLAFAR
jgi:hypothetical protein